MTTNAHDFPEVLAALEPYLADVVLIGGWVPHLYRVYGNLQWQGAVSRTTEGDVLVPSILEPNGRPKLRELLEAAGMRPARKEHFPADWIAIDTEATAVEFIMANPGPVGIKSPHPIGAQGWMGAIVVEDARLLQSITNTLKVATGRGQLDVKVPSLGAWAVGKALTFGARQAASGAHGESKRAKDLLYIRDLVFAGGRVLQQVDKDLVEIASNATWSLTLRRAVDRLAPVAAKGASVEVNAAANQLAIREGRSAGAAVAEIRSASRELIDIIEATLPAKH